jgi:hypothetical protein
MQITLSAPGYAEAMGRLLMLYTQVDRLIMEVCAERLPSAPDEDAELALAKQIGDESRHVAIQREWMARAGCDTSPVIGADQEATIRAHFRKLDWLDFLADLYVAVEALGGHAVEEVVPLADPGTRASLAIPLADEVDHVEFGLSRLRLELARLPEARRHAFLARLPARVESLADRLHEMVGGIRVLFEAVGADYGRLVTHLDARRAELLAELGTPLLVMSEPRHAMC